MQILGPRRKEIRKASVGSLQSELSKFFLSVKQYGRLFTFNTTAASRINTFNAAIATILIYQLHNRRRLQHLACSQFLLHRAKVSGVSTG